MLLNPYIKDELILMKIRLIRNIQYFDFSLFLCTFYSSFIIELSTMIILYKDYILYLKNNNKNYNFKKNERIRILRIESKTGEGPYRSNIDLLNREHSEQHPTPFNDFEDIWMHLLFTNQYKEYKFGFKDLKQFNDWFSLEEQKILFDNGFIMTEHDTKNYYMSNKQLIFK